MDGLARKTFLGAICGVVESRCGVVELHGEQRGLAFYAPYTTYYMPLQRKTNDIFVPADETEGEEPGAETSSHGLPRLGKSFFSITGSN